MDTGDKMQDLIKSKISRIPKNMINTIWIILSTGVHSLFQWLLIIAMTKIFGIDTVGQYSWSNAIIVPVITFLGLNLRAVQLTDVRNKYDISDYIIIRIISSILSIFVIILILVVRNSSFYIITITLLQLIFKISELFSEIFQSNSVKNDNFKNYCISFLLRSILSFLSFIAISLISHDYIISLLSYSIVWVLVLVFYDAHSFSLFEAHKHVSFNKKHIIEIIMISLPLAFVASVNTLYNSIPKFFVEYFMDMESVGIFSATSYVSLIGGLFVSGITLTFAAKLAVIYSRGDAKKFLHIIMIQQILVLSVCLVIYLIFLLFGDKILPILYTEEFIQYQDVILLLVIATSLSFTANVFGTACTSVRLNKEQLYISIICIVIILLSGYLLVPSLGLYGAAYSMILAYVVKNGTLGFILFRKLSCKFDQA